MNRNINFKTLDEKKKEYSNAKIEWEAMKEQEKKLKEKFYSSPFEQRAKIKRELKLLQDTMFEKRDCGTFMKIDIKNEEMLQRLKNPTGSPTDPHHLANLIKEELRAILNGSQKMKTGDEVGDIWEANHSQEICYFGKNKEVNELIANLARNRQKPLDPDKITTRMVRVKQEDFSATDFNEMISLIHQVKNFLEDKNKQDQHNKENIKLNNSHLFTQWKCSSDGKYNGRGRWENWHTFSGKHNGFDYTIYVPDNHIALTNCLFDDGWGTNSEVSKFFVVKGAVKPTTLRYWNVAKQRSEIISEAEAQSLIKWGKERYIGYKTYVELSDKITIDHYRGNGQELAKPVSGVNQEVENNNHQNTSRDLVANRTENTKSPTQADTEILLQYFKDHDIKEISLESKDNLMIIYNDGRSANQFNSQELQKVISYCQKNGQTSLSRQELINLENTNSPQATTASDNNKIIWIGCSAGIFLAIGIVAGLLLRKRKVKSN